MRELFFVENNDRKYFLKESISSITLQACCSVIRNHL